MILILRNFFALIAILSVTLPSLVFAHGIHFKSISELEDHIQAHITELESISQNAAPVSFDELLQHTHEYRHFAAKLKTFNPELADAIMLKTSDLQLAAQKRNLSESLRVLKDLAGAL
jgi:hypothetical protein